MGGDRPLIRIDLPGHGRSPRRRVASFTDLARQVVETFDDACRDHDRIDILGHSLGGALALALVDIRPRRVRSLAMIAPAGLGPEVHAQALAGITRATRAEKPCTVAAVTNRNARRDQRRLRQSGDALAGGCLAAGLSERSGRRALPRQCTALRLAPRAVAVGLPHDLNLGPQGPHPSWRQSISVTGDFALHLLSEAAMFRRSNARTGWRAS